MDFTFILFVFVLPIWFSISIIALIIDRFLRMPEESKIIKRAVNRHRGILIVSYDDGGIEFHEIKEVLPEGALITKSDLTFCLPRMVMQNPRNTFQQRNELSKDTKKTNQEETKNGLEFPVAYWMARFREVLRKSKTITWIGYAGKSVATTIQGTARTGYEFYPIHIADLKTAFPDMYNQATIRSIEHKSEMIGYKKARKFLGPEAMKMILLTMLIIGGLIIGGAILIKLM